MMDCSLPCKTLLTTSRLSTVTTTLQQDFVNQLEHERNEREAEEKEFSAKEEGKVEDTQEAWSVS